DRDLRAPHAQDRATEGKDPTRAVLDLRPRIGVARDRTEQPLVHLIGSARSLGRHLVLWRLLRALPWWHSGPPLRTSEPAANPGAARTRPQLDTLPSIPGSGRAAHLRRAANCRHRC